MGRAPGEWLLALAGVAGPAIVTLNLRTGLARPDSGAGESRGLCGVCSGAQGPVQRASPLPRAGGQSRLGNTETRGRGGVRVWREGAHALARLCARPQTAC